jgi:hypothetical protein
MGVKKPRETHFPLCERGIFRSKIAEALHNAG